MKIFDTRDELMWAICKPKSRILEIGVFKGEFADTLLATGPELLILCDPWDSRSVSGDADGNNVIEADLPAEFERLLKKHDGDRRVAFLRGRSPQALTGIPPKSLDVVYIDGDHSFLGCRSDLYEALRLVRPGGWICGHDYEMNPKKTAARYDFGVKRAVDGFCLEQGLQINAVGLDGCVSYAIRVPS